MLLPQASLSRCSFDHQPSAAGYTVVKLFVYIFQKLYQAQHSCSCIKQAQDAQPSSNWQLHGLRVHEWRERANPGFITWPPGTPAQIEGCCSSLKANFISMCKGTFQPISCTWVSPSHIKPRGRRGISGGTLCLPGSMRASHHTCIGVLGICSLPVLEGVGKLRLELRLRGT